ncbi:MAG: Rrf2 family transcriptional regulator [Lachnospiraceae bacterium]|nr:Rrf2 family transcriptional regulator [Lachnospiraceae bacterium]
MRVSKRFPLAVHCLLFVAVLSPKKRVTSTLVAESTGANAVTVRNLFLELADSDLLVATAGKNGGVHLAREPKDITLLDIYQAVETPDADEIFKMYEGSDDCPIGGNFYQILHPHMVSAVNAMKAELEQVTLETLKEELQSLLKELHGGEFQ